MTDKETLLIRLAEAEAAYHRLMVGKQAVTISHGDSAGNSRSYQYSTAGISDLRAYIIELKSKLGLCTGRRRPAGVRL
ncbi:hypothetical protein NM534_004325 [Enterobacter hormaechei]|nr:hypothetical protein [Enterobacter hormaechei]